MCAPGLVRRAWKAFLTIQGCRKGPSIKEQRGVVEVVATKRLIKQGRCKRVSATLKRSVFMLAPYHRERK